MAKHGEITLVWADGEHTFALDLGAVRELQDKCDAGPAWIASRLQSQQWRIDDVRETIRLGLIGGGMTPADAHKLCVRYVDNRPLRESVQIAFAILEAFLSGVEGDEVGKSEPAGTPETAGTTSHGESGGSPDSTEPAP